MMPLSYADHLPEAIETHKSRNTGHQTANHSPGQLVPPTSQKAEKDVPGRMLLDMLFIFCFEQIEEWGEGGETLVLSF